MQHGDTLELLRANKRRNRLEWNPALGDDCSGLYINWWLCVGVQPQTSVINTEVYTSTYTSWTETPLPSVDYSFTPTPTQSGIVEGCQAFYHAKTVCCNEQHVPDSATDVSFPG